QKKQNRETKEGLINFYFCSTSNDFTVCKISCETDFVAKNKDFLLFSNNVTKIIHDNSTSNQISHGSFEDIKGLKDNSKTIDEILTDTISKIGENIQIENFTSYKTNDYIFLTYLHNKYSDNASKIGSVIGLKVDNEIKDEIKKDLQIIPMQVSAMRPMAIDEENLDPKIIEDEKDIIKKQIDNLDNPKIDQIITGKLNKFIKENTLLNQTLISDPKKTIKELISEISSKNNSPIKIMIMDLFSI
ncbi:MAG: translation elongation factor Ts, partial [Pelagibacteraceae bacterium]|nr:translation elongation factor Ts [Pelagibacteraceae bacterium]